MDRRNANPKDLNRLCKSYLKKLCEEIPERPVGSEGNREATRFFESEIASNGWETELQEFDAMDWEEGGAALTVADTGFDVRVSPYSRGCEVEAKLVSVSSIAELERADIHGRIVLLHGEIAREQLMPKNFVFYNPEDHQKIIALLERGNPQAIVCATGRNAALAGGVSPFPMIEDGDFDIPSVYMAEEEGRKLLSHIGKSACLKSVSRRIPGKGCNVVARQGDPANGRIVVTAHIDAKKGTPGAIDNGTGVAVLLLLSGLLKRYSGKPCVEIVAFNGEDYYAVPGQMLYVQLNQNQFDGILVNINIDGAGYFVGKSVFSFYGLSDKMEQEMKRVLSNFHGMTEGVQWPQGDHSIFVQHGRPAIAVSSRWFTESMDSQAITHTPKDNLNIVDWDKVVEIAGALADIIYVI